ncbi:MAG: hypothetical protein QOJ09_2095, partial [Actinomycetota bacterium]|nr:hypothetical protein [Actinomycetota bacterium]
VSGEHPTNLDQFPWPAVHSLGIVRTSLPRVVAGRATTAALMWLAWRRKVGVVHVHFGYLLGEVLGAARRMGLPVVVSMHGHDVTAPLRSDPGRYAGELDRVDAVIVPSHFLAAGAVALGAPTDRVHVIPAGVDTDRFTPSPLPEGPPEALFVGRFVEKKGIEVLMAAWPEVRRRLPAARLRVLGYGPLADLVRGPGVERELEPSHDRVRAAIGAATVVVSPSRTGGDGDAESLLLVNLEAQASGRAVVTTDHGGIPEFVHAGETALVVPEADPAALADALTALLGDRALATRFGAAGPSVAARFDLRHSAARVDDLYDSLVSARRRPRSRRRDG